MGGEATEGERIGTAGACQWVSGVYYTPHTFISKIYGFFSISCRRGKNKMLCKEGCYKITKACRSHLNERVCSTILQKIKSKTGTHWKTN